MSKEKKKEQKTSFAQIVIFILLIVAIILIIITPILLLSGFIFYSSKSRQYDFIKGNLSDFWLTKSEKSHFAQLHNTILEAKNIMLKVNQRRKEQISSGQTIDAELKIAIEQTEQTIVDSEKQYNDLSNMPHEKWLIFSKVIVRKKACFLGMISWMVSGAILIFIYANSFFGGIELFAKFPILLSNGELKNSDWKILLVTTAVALIGYFIGTKIYKNSPDRFSPEPPIVTAENYDKY